MSIAVVDVVIWRESSVSGSSVFFFNDTATTEIYTLSLHDALPIYQDHRAGRSLQGGKKGRALALPSARQDRKSTRLNSSHLVISYAVFCLKKKKITFLLRMHLSLTSSLIHTVNITCN